MEKTRVLLGQELHEWKKSPIGATTMKWVSGGAGDGKTTLLLTFADLCRRQKHLIGAFFASNQITDCSDGNQIIATLAVQLMQALPSTAKYIDKALGDDPYLFSKGLQVQMNALIVEPINRIATKKRMLAAITFGLKTYPTLIVIDGLDEIAEKDDQTVIIETIGKAMRDVRLPLRFLVSSRGADNISDGIEQLQKSEFTKDRVSIMDLKKDTQVDGDIRHFFEVKFGEIRAKYTHLKDWPGDRAVDDLVGRASGQFIFATTIMSYIMDKRFSPETRLQVIRTQGPLKGSPGHKPYKNLDDLYFLIVANVGDANLQKGMLRILTLIIIINQLIATANAPAGTFAELCSPRTLGDILGFQKGEVRRCLNDMHSVVNIGDDDCDVQIYCKSFPDFLLDPSRSHKFAVNVEDACGHDHLFSHLIGTSQHQDTILQVLGQCFVSEEMSSDVDIIGTPANASSPNRIEMILGLEHGTILPLLQDIRLLLEVGDGDQDIGIRVPFLRSFLLDQSRSQDLFLDLDDVRHTLKFAAPIRKVFGAQGM